MNNNNARMISQALREKVLERLSNKSLSSREVSALIEEVGQIVVNLQTLYFAEIVKLEKRVAGMLEELESSLEEHAKNTTVNVNLSSHIDPESIVKALADNIKNPFLKL